MHRWLVVVSVVALVGGAAWVASAQTAAGSPTPVNCMDTEWRTTGLSTSSTHFSTVTGLTDSPSAVFPIAIDVSATVSGAPAEFRVLSTNIGAQTRQSKPGVTRFVPKAGSRDAFSFQWIEPNQTAAVHVIDLKLQWRSPSGQPTHLGPADMSVTYATTRGACTG
jgi:hypothetical protein